MFYVLSPLINAVVGFIISFSIIKNNKTKTNIAFFITYVNIALWSLSYFFWQKTSDLSTALFWCQMLMSFAIFVPPFYLLFFSNLTDQVKKYKNIVIAEIAVGVIFLWFNWFTGTFIIDIVELTAWGTTFKLWPIAGPSYHVFLFLWFTASIHAIIVLYKSFKKSTGIKKSQLTLIFYGVILTLIGSTTNFFLWYKILIPPFGNIAFSIQCIIVGYGIIKYHFLDARVIMEKTLIYVVLTLFTFFSFHAVQWFMNIFYDTTSMVATYRIGALLSVIFVICFFLFDQIVRNFFASNIFYNFHNYEKTLKEFTADLVKNNNVDKIIEEITRILKEVLYTKEVAFTIYNEGDDKSYYNDLEQFFQSNNIFYTEEASTLIKAQKKDFSNRTLLKIKDRIASQNFTICLPLKDSNIFFGYIMLAEKTNGEKYTDRDLTMLITLSQQTSIAIHNSLQYAEIQDLKNNLEKKVKIQTRVLEKRALELEKTNKKQRELLAMKNEFLRVVNHQLNTPISIMKGYLSMIGDNSFSTEEIDKVLNNELERISITVADFWEAYSMEGENDIAMNPAPLAIKPIIQKMVEEKQKLSTVKERNLEVVLVNPELEIPEVWADAKKITHVISNLIDNAVFYTRAGSIKIGLDSNNGFVNVTVEDTGHGITEQDRQKLFKKFSRGNDANSLNPNGSGLGLYIAHKIIERSGGQITVQSSGLNKGSKFSFTLPVYAGQNQEERDPNKTTTGMKIEIFK